MLGSSSNLFNPCIVKILKALNPDSVIDIGAGQGKLGLLGSQVIPEARFTALQHLFAPGEAELLYRANYKQVIDQEIMTYMREGFDERYSLATICDVLEHFLYSDAISIIKFLAYRCDWILIVWPSKHPQNGDSSSFDRHRFSMTPSELFNHFDVVRYEQSGFSQYSFHHLYHLAIIRGDMNTRTTPIF